MGGESVASGSKVIPFFCREELRIIQNELAKAVKHRGQAHETEIGYEKKPFICASDLHRIWSENSKLKSLSDIIKKESGREPGEDLSEDEIRCFSFCFHVSQPEWLGDNLSRLREDNVKLSIKETRFDKLLNTAESHTSLEKEQKKFVQPHRLRLYEYELQKKYEVDSKTPLPLQFPTDTRASIAHGSFANVYVSAT